MLARRCDSRVRRSAVRSLAEDERTRKSVSPSITESPSRAGTLVYLNADPDLAVVLGRIEKAGGQVLVPKTQISPEFGFMAVFVDCEGNRVALHSRAWARHRR